MKLPEFKSQAERLKYLVKNKAELIELKKASVKHTNPFGGSTLQSAAVKALNTHFTDDIASGIIKRTIVGNTYNWMDSHSDVHADGIFGKSIQERHDKIFHLVDHEQKITAKIGKPEKIYEKSVAWADLGVDFPGKTEALFMDSNIIKDYNPMVYGQYLAKEITQHSVGMVYVKLDLAVNDPEMKAEFAVWTKVINSIANKQRALDQGYFWYVQEAKLIEISAVLAGSNEITPTVNNEKGMPAVEDEVIESKGIDYAALVDKLD